MVKLLKENFDYSAVGVVLSNEYSMYDLDDVLWSRARYNWINYTDEQKAYLIDYFNESGAEQSLTNFNDYIWFEADDILEDAGLYTESVNEDIWGSHYTDYDPKEGWTEEDIELHKSIDWTGRNYEKYPVEEDSFMHNAVLYGVHGGPIRKEVKFIKYIRSNPIYPPYYGPVDRKPFDGVTVGYVGPMYDGHKHKTYDVHDRFETQETYDMLSH